MLIGSLVTAGGMSVIAVLVLRAVGEWRTLDDQPLGAHPRRGSN